MKKKIKISSNEKLEKYSFLATEFLSDIFDIEEGIFTDMTEISDFCGRGLTIEQINSADSYNAICTLWDELIINKIKEKYNIQIDKTNILLTDVLEKIYNSKTFKKTIH